MVISVKKLMKRFGDYTVIDQLNLEVGEGEIYGILGPSGSGKTTFLQCLLTLISHDKGSIKLFGETMSTMQNATKKRIGVCFQENAVFETLTVYDNILYFSSLYLKEKTKTKQAVETILESLGLKEYRNIYYFKLDEGRQKLCNFACAVVHNPDLVLIDGGFGNCDPKLKHKIYEKLKDLRNQGKTILLTTHSIDEAEEICDKIAIMDRGRILSHGTKEELKKSISLGERSRIHVYHLAEEQMAQLRLLPGVFYVSYEKEMLTIKSKKGRNNLLHILDYFQKNDIAFGEIVSELPTLDDVFLEMTGKQFADNKKQNKSHKKASH